MIIYNLLLTSSLEAEGLPIILAPAIERYELGGIVTHKSSQTSTPNLASPAVNIKFVPKGILSWKGNDVVSSITLTPSVNHLFHKIHYS